MAEVTLSLDQFWTLRQQLPVVDARSEGEFEQSHIPGAVNLPILNNAERITVGTLYQLSKKGLIDTSVVADAITKLGINPEKISPMTA